MTDVQIWIYSGGKAQLPILADDITWKTERTGVPGELTFTAIKEGKLSFSEGAPVHMTVDGKDVFYGYVFTKNRDKDQRIKVTAYDQLRYLKNKDTYCYENKTATEVIREIVSSTTLRVGSLADTKYKYKHMEIGSTYFDIIQNSLDATLAFTNEMYVLYDDFGKLTLKNIKDMIVNYLVHPSTAENMDYTSTIDEGVYNKIKLYEDNGEDGTRNTWIAQSSSSIQQYGTLQYCEQVPDLTMIDAGTLADALLKLYNEPKRKLTVKGVLGDVRVRAGSVVPTNLHLGDQMATINQLMIVENATHKWSKGHYSMDLLLTGRGRFEG